MTVFERANSLFNRFMYYTNYNALNARLAAIDCCEEIISSYDCMLDAPDAITIGVPGKQELIGGIEYWRRVIDRLNKVYTL